MNATDPILSIRDLSIAFGHGAREVLAVDRVSFDIRKGETLALVGESGSGKSITALSVMKLLPYPAAHHPSGSIKFQGRELLTMKENEIRDVRGRIGQQFHHRQRGDRFSGTGLADQRQRLALADIE